MNLCFVEKVRTEVNCKKVEILVGECRQESTVEEGEK